MNRSRTLCAGALILALSGCSRSDAGAESSTSADRQPQSMEFPVEVATVQSQPVEYAINAVGSIEAFEQVAVTARVAGVVERVRFTEGQSVSPSGVLVEIEPERYRLGVDAAAANVEKALAERAEAEAGLARRSAASAKNPGLIRGEEVETWRTRVLTKSAEVSQARTALQQARLNLRDAFVRAPIGGEIQSRSVQTGQYVQPGTVLATLERRDPLLLRFQVPEEESKQIRRGQRVRFAVGDANVEYSAQVSYVAESADPASRMVMLSAQINDPNRLTIKPGAFARVTIPVGGGTIAPVIPQTAIRPSERGFLAFVVRDGKAQERVLSLGLRTPDGKVEVKNGLAAGEVLVVRGAEALRDGAVVKIGK